MTRWIMLFMAVALLSGCEGEESTETSQPDNQTSNENAAQSSDTNASQSANQKESADRTGTQTAGYESPEAVFAALQQAAKDDDFATAVRCLDPESQEAMAVMMTLPLGFMAAFDPEKEKEVEKLLSRHGISLEEDADEFPLKTTESRIAFMTDVMEWMEANADSTEESSGPLKNIAQGSLGDVAIEGDRATAAVTLADNEPEEIEFARIEGKWYLRLTMEPEFSSGPMTGPGGNEPFGDSDFGAFGGDDEPPPPIEAVPLEKFHSAWQVTLNEKDQPARELLAKLAMQLGLELKADAGLEAALQTPVSLEKFEGSQWEAIEKIARQIDVTPSYSTSFIEFEAGQRELPVAFAGPFVIDVTNFETDPQTATGQMSLQVIAAGLPATVVTLLEEGIGSPLELTAVTDSGGHELRRDSGSGSGMIGFGGMSPNASVFQRELMIGLKNLLRRVESIDALQGRISFSLPTKVEVLKFDELKQGAEKKAAGVTLELTQINGGSVTFKYHGADNDAIHLLAFDAQGKRIASFGSGSFGGGGSGQVSEEYESAPARIEARIVTQQEELEYEFHFEDIPVPNHGAMPLKLAELKFEGESPISLKFDSFTGEENFREIKMRVTNHSNKDAELISMELSYLDGQGKELKNFPTSHGFDVVPAGESTDIEVSAFFMPEGAKSVKPILRSVEFTDATEWGAE